MRKKKKYKNNPKFCKEKFRPKKPQAYKSVKCSLKSILSNPQKMQPKINDLVIKCNDIVIEAYHFIRLYYLHRYHNNQTLPIIDKDFIMYVFKAMATRGNRGRKPKNNSLKTELDLFYEFEFKHLLVHNSKFNMEHMGYILSYLAIQMITAINNNLKVHFITRLLRFINKTAPEYESSLSKSECKRNRNSLKKALFQNDLALAPEIYKTWLNTYRYYILPTKWEKTLVYDIKADPSKYLIYSFRMNEILEAKGYKLFQPLSLRSEIIPHYITLDTASLIDYFHDDNKAELLGNITDYQEWLWLRYFKTNTTVFRKKNYRFNFTIQTDGIGASILFTHRLHNKWGKSSNCQIEEEDQFLYFEDLSLEELDKIKDVKIVGADPGKYSLLYLSDGNKKLRYNAFQRNTESMAKRNKIIMMNEKRKHDVIEKETELSIQNSKTVDYQRFKDYIKEKNKINAELKEFYIRDLFRKLKWRTQVYSRKSEDKFLNKIESTFSGPEEICIAYGDWSRSSQMKHFMPTKGVGLRKLIAKRFLTISVDEFRTSKLCNRCYKELSYYKPEGEKKVFRCQICKECGSSESKQPRFLTRDLNAALNMRNLALNWLKMQTRPSAFKRAEGLTVTQNNEEKTSQYVDLTMDNAIE